MASIRVTALVPGDGEAVAALWKDLWILHESWNGYRAARDSVVYTQLATRLESWAERRRADPLLGQHLHLVARDERNAPIGQVEGWLDRLGQRAPHTCEIRSLVVRDGLRAGGVGRALVRELERLAQAVVRGPTFMAAEVLVPNPGLGFYERLGYRTLSHTKMLAVSSTPPRAGARLAQAHDAFPLAHLEMERRGAVRQRGDLRVDPPSAVDATFAATVAEHVHGAPGAELVALSGSRVVAQGSLGIATLEAPFVPVVRAALGRVSTCGGEHAALGPLLELARHRASRRGAARLELADLPPSDDHPASRILAAAGATPFSRIVGRLLP